MAKIKKTASKNKSEKAAKPKKTVSVAKAAGNKAVQILFAASEVFPLVKTGGLADVACYLPMALHELGYDVRIVMPAYRSVLKQCAGFRAARSRRLADQDIEYRLYSGKLPGTKIPVYLIDIPELFDRPGDPYHDKGGAVWSDNADRFAAFGRVIRLLALGRAGLRWRPDIVHCNDWHTGLAPALLARDPRRPATVFTIHNLAYQGDFSYDQFQSLQLPEDFWSPEAMEFYGRFAFIKGGLVYADRLVTVSPEYAGEVLTREYGFGMEGLLYKRRQALSGILNGVDYRVWDPRHDPLIERQYWLPDLDGKTINKRQLQRQQGLVEDENAVLLAHISRLTWQKGIDLILDSISTWMQTGDIQLVVLGSGEAQYVNGLQTMAARYPGRMAIRLDYDENLAHRIQAGADMLLMPSRYEPCGLTQMYSLRYGTIPVVRRTGGLADTVVDATEETLAAGTATGFHFIAANTSAFLHTVSRAIERYRSGSAWRQLMHTAMEQDFSWIESAGKYTALYLDLLKERAGRINTK